MPSYEPKQFDIAIAKIKDEMRQVYAKRLGDFVEDLHDRILARTPVDTGQAAANFQVTAGRPYAGVVAAPGPRTPGAGSMPLGTEPNRERAESIAKASFSRGMFRSPYQTYYITNNTPHILALEYGDASQRAPNGMVGLAVTEARFVSSGRAPEI